MEMTSAASTLSALAHEGRLGVFRLLVQAGPDGLPAGEIARAMGAPASTLSSHLSVLSMAGLIVWRRRGRSIIYAPALDRMTELLRFLLEDCCSGNVAICAPLSDVVGRRFVADALTGHPTP